MHILLIGYENDITFIKKTIKKNDTTIKTLLWNQIEAVSSLTAQYLSTYDCIIIGVKDLKASQDIYNLIKLLNNNNSTNLLDFYTLFHATIPAMTADKVMKNPNQNNYDGLIFDISHAEVGIIPQCLSANFANLAVSSQDIYYNMKTLEYCTAQYYSKIKNLKYIIFDMFDYTYFNYDVSLSRTAGSYANYGGFTLDSHNFQANKSFAFSFDDLKSILLARRYPDIQVSQLDLWDSLFENVHFYNNYYEFNNYVDIFLRNRIVSEQDVSDYEVNTNIVKNIYSSTINENIQYFHHFLQLAYNINPSLKIYCILMPRYYKAQEKAQNAYAPWKEIFYTIIDESQKKIPFTFLDLKEHEISKRKECYYDISHFNYYGAITFSNYLNTLIT